MERGVRGLFARTVAEQESFEGLASFCRETRKGHPNTHFSPRRGPRIAAQGVALDGVPTRNPGLTWVNPQDMGSALEGRLKVGWIPQSSRVSAAHSRAWVDSSGFSGFRVSRRKSTILQMDLHAAHYQIDPKPGISFQQSDLNFMRASCSLFWLE